MQHFLQLIARAESSDNLVQSLQSQLIDLQKKDTALKVRERNDDLIRSLQERHEKETYALQDEVNRLNTKVRKSDDDLHSLRDQLSGNQRHYDSMILEKSERIEELNAKLSESQKRLTKMIIANTAGNENGIGDPLKEICNLKSHLAEMTQQRNEQSKQTQDLNVSRIIFFIEKSISLTNNVLLQDEIAELQSQLSALQSKVVPNAMNIQKELSQLRTQIQIKDDNIYTLQTKEQELIRDCDRMQVRTNV